MILQTRYLGVCDYEKAWELQKRLVILRQQDIIPDTLLLLQHPPTFTLGRSAKREHLLVSASHLESERISVIDTDRGGDITYHGPGQLVGYPILRLDRSPNTPNLHGYLRKIEESIIIAVKQYGVVAGRFSGYTGVWLNRDDSTHDKIAAIGIRCSRWVTQHGFALNISTDLNYFDYIIPCGIKEYGVTSLEKEIGRKLTIEDAIDGFIPNFAEVFGYEQMIEMREKIID